MQAWANTGRRDVQSAQREGRMDLGAKMGYARVREMRTNRNRAAHAAVDAVRKADHWRAERERLGVPTVADFDRAGISMPQVRTPLSNDALAKFRESFQNTLGVPITPSFIKELAGIHASIDHEKLAVTHTVTANTDWNGKLSVRVSATINNIDGKEVGSLEREYHRDDDGKIVVHHEFFRIHESIRASGIGKKTLQNQVRQYVKLGVDRVETEAAWDGQYVWPHMGFELRNPRHLDEHKSEFRTYMREQKGMKPATIDRIINKVKSIQDIADVKYGRGKIQQNPGKDYLLWRGNEKYGNLIPLKAPLASGSPLRQYLGV